jgi:hypothetical protein
MVPDLKCARPLAGRCACCGSNGLTRRGFVAAGAALATVTLGPGRSAAAAGTPPPSLDAWLAAHGNVAASITWHFGKGQVPAFAEWPGPFKERLRAAFVRAWNGEPSGLIDPPPNQYPAKDDESPTTIFRAEDAFALYAALTATSLAQEIGRRLPWSVTNYDRTSLETLFSGHLQFDLQPGGGYRLNFGLSIDIGINAVPAPPEVALQFLRANNILGRDRRETIVNIVRWCRDYLTHFIGRSGTYTREADEVFQYRGQVPVSRVIRGTIYTGEMIPRTDYDRRRHWTDGCWGTVGFLASVLRTVNIPAERLWAPILGADGKPKATHCAPFFPTEQLTLSHGDDPYDYLCRLQPSFPVDQLLMTRKQFDAWFPGGVPPGTPTRDNVGRRVYDLALVHLPIAVVNNYAIEKLQGLPQGERIVKMFGTSRYPRAELDKTNLWKRLDAKLAELGGPEKVRALYVNEIERYERQSIATTAM